MLLFIAMLNCTNYTADFQIEELIDDWKEILLYVKNIKVAMIEEAETKRLLSLERMIRHTILYEKCKDCGAKCNHIDPRKARRLMSESYKMSRSLNKKLNYIRCYINQNSFIFHKCLELMEYERLKNAYVKYTFV